MYRMSSVGREGGGVEGDDEEGCRAVLPVQRARAEGAGGGEWLW